MQARLTGSDESVDTELLKSKCPTLHSSILSTNFDRLDEFSKVFDKLLNGLENVQNGKISMTEMREKLFEKELADKYMHT
jgi:hypothetical protein